MNPNNTEEDNSSKMEKTRHDPGETDTASSKKPLVPMRYLQCTLIFVGLAIAFAQRVNLSVAIVAMTDKNSSNTDFSEFSWSEKIKSMLLSSFFWGYVFMQVPAGQMAQKFGGKTMLQYGMIICSLLTIVTPYCAEVGGWKLLCASRVIQGLCQGVFYPSTHTILSKWAPVEERGVMGTASYSGGQLGTVVMLASSGILASSSFGWPSIFYTPGVAGLIWVVAWYLWAASTPSEHKSITAAERKLIESSLGQVTNDDEPKRVLKTPWMKFFTSVPFWMLLIAHSGNNWGFWMLLTQIPTYMRYVLDMDIKQNAVLSALPYTAMFFMGFFFSALSVVLTKKQWMPLSVSRKFFNSIGQWIPMVSLVALSYVGKDQPTLAICLLTITIGINAATFLGFVVNHMDLSPNFAGVMFGVTNFVANVMSLLAPLVVGFVVSDETDPSQWRIVFFTAAIFYLVGNLLFVLFGSTETQPYNNPEIRVKSSEKDVIEMESQH